MMIFILITSLPVIFRNYAELRWDKRLTITNFSNVPRYAEVSLRVTTRASAVPFQNWDWE